MAQHEDLDVFGTLKSAAQDEQIDHEPDKPVETGNTPILGALRPRRSRQRETPGQHTARVFGTDGLIVVTIVFMRKNAATIPTTDASGLPA